MSHRTTRKRSRLTPAELMTQYLDDRNDELLDAVVTSAAADHADSAIGAVRLISLLPFHRGSARMARALCPAHGG